MRTPKGGGLGFEELLTVYAECDSLLDALMARLFSIGDLARDILLMVFCCRYEIQVTLHTVLVYNWGGLQDFDLRRI